MRRAADKDTTRRRKQAPESTSKLSHQMQHGYHPTFGIASAYIGTFCMYLLANLLPNLPELPFTWMKPLSPSDQIDPTGTWSSISQVILALMFTFHFCRRALETVFVHTYVRTHPLFELIGAHIYYWVLAFWMGWSIREDRGYVPTHTPLFLAGVIIFWIGQTGNCAVHLQLRNIRKQKLTKASAPSGRAIPRGMLFSLVSCPHFSFEILIWLGFALASMVPASFGILIATVIVLIQRSSEYHARYKKEFDGKGGRELYPPNRKALIPFVL